MGLTTLGRTWDDASSQAALDLARRFEEAWRAQAHRGGPRPILDDYLPSNPRQRAAVLLALLRTELALRLEAGDTVAVEDYLARYPELSDEALVALIYEDFCLREEAGATPAVHDYLARFPRVALRLKRVLEIHDLVGSGASASLGVPVAEIAFPEAGQTIAGFRLIAELGRGAFARVFLAQERQLADRRVALKVARRGSREPQALARLQHTHIVPVHSYRTDPATGLHLLCMPYFGCVTLARLLADPAVKVARSGAELLEALDRLGTSDSGAFGQATGRTALAARSFPAAVAWWGARLAEALQHAHDRGVLHRDIKPSNVLVTSDGMPMLLDFNLARDSTELQPETLGGTLAYMAPEHLEALAEGRDERVDGRADIYALGVVLYEALVGEPPFAPPTGAATIAEALRRAAAQRRHVVARLRVAHPEIPAALDAVLRRCLAPHSEDRYRAAGELAADLHAVADDEPLRFAREPLLSRSVRWLRRHRHRMTVAAPLMLALMLALNNYQGTRLDRARREAHVENWIAWARQWYDQGDYDKAKVQYDLAARLADPGSELHARAREGYNLARQKGEAYHRAQRLFQVGDPLRFHLIGADGDLAAAWGDLTHALDPFYVLQNLDWTELSGFALLDDTLQARLRDEVNELLFLAVVATDRPPRLEQAHRLVAICDQMLSSAQPQGPWVDLRNHCIALVEGAWPPVPGHDNLSGEDSPRACFQWGLLCDRQGRPDLAADWLDRATRLRPNNYWYQYTLGYHFDRAGDTVKALERYRVAIGIDPDAPWTRFRRARIFAAQGDWTRALDDLNRAADTARDFEFLLRVYLELAHVHQNRGDTTAAQDLYQLVVDLAPESPSAHQARQNLADLADSHAN